MRRGLPSRLGLGLLFAAGLLASCRSAGAINLAVTATVGNTGQPANPTVEFRGRASASTTVTVKRDGTDITSQVTDAQARFDIDLVDQPTGQHTYDILANDAVGREHASATFALNLSSGGVVLITGIFLGPTIDVNKESLTIGETVTIFGRTAPSSALTLEVDTHNYTFTADSSGDWTKSINTTELGTGTHTATAMAVAESTSSEDSLQATFAVHPAAPCDGKSRADLNCDGRVNLTDFSILLFFWLQTNPSNDRADINLDGTVTIIDFSIMLFQWTG